MITNIRRGLRGALSAIFGKVSFSAVKKKQGSKGIKDGWLRDRAIILVLLTVFSMCESGPAAAYMFGSSADQVQIQRRLSDWGYYFAQ